MVLLGSEARYASKENFVFMEALVSPPLAPADTRVSVVISRYAVWNHATLLNPIKALQAERHLLRNSYRNDSAVQSTALSQPDSRSDLTLGQIVNRVQPRDALEKQQGWQSIRKHVQMGVDDVRAMMAQDAM